MVFQRAGRVIRALAGLMLLVGGTAWAENVKDLPKPTSYVSDFAGVLDDGTKQEIERLCGEVARQANAQIAVVTIHSLGEASIEDFSADLEQKWGVGKKGSDRGVLMLFAMDDKKDRIEVGYGLEGLLNDAKVGDILRAERPLMEQGQYSQAIQGDLQQVTNDIAADAGVTLTQPEQHTYHRETERRSNPIGTGLRIFFFLLVLWLIFRRRGGRGGGYGGGGGGFLPGSLLGNMLGGSRGGFGGGGGSWGGGSSGGNNDGGGFGGFDGGSSGGGGASGDW